MGRREGVEVLKEGQVVAGKLEEVEKRLGGEEAEGVGIESLRLLETKWRGGVFVVVAFVALGLCLSS